MHAQPGPRAATTVVIYLLGKEFLGQVGAGVVAFLWALLPLPMASNRILKDTLATFFAYLAIYLYCRGKKATEDVPGRAIICPKQCLPWSGDPGWRGQAIAPQNTNW